MPQHKTPGVYKMNIRMAHLPILGPFGVPVTVTVTNGGMTDRVGTIVDCSASTSAAKLSCGTL